MLCGPHQAFDVVPDAAVVRAAYVLTKMLEHCPSEVLARMVAAKAALAIVGRNQVLSGR